MADRGPPSRSSLPAGLFLDNARHHALLSELELWTGSVGLGGTATLEQVRAYLGGSGEVPLVEHNTLVQVINERLMDLGLNSPVPYLEPDRRLDR